MTLQEYLGGLQENPWSFPAVGGVIPDDEWVAAAWEVEAIREPIVADMQREISKTGTPNYTDECFGLLAQALHPDRLSELYERLRDHSLHREAEFRPHFDRALGANAWRLPKPLTRLRLVRALGRDLAEQLLWDDYASDAERVLYLKVLPRAVDLFLAIDPPGFEPYCDDEFDAPVEHVIANLPACGSRKELGELIRDGFRRCWLWEKLCTEASAEVEARFDRLADEVWRLWSDVKRSGTSV